MAISFSSAALSPWISEKIRSLMQTRLASGAGIATARRRLIWFPQDLRRAEHVIHPAAPNEKGVTQPIQVLNGFGGDLFLARQAHCDSLRPAANCPASMQLRI